MSGRDNRCWQSPKAPGKTDQWRKTPESKRIQSTIKRLDCAVTAADGASANVRIICPQAPPKVAIYWLPALGVGIRPNERFAEALAELGVAVAIHEWRGLGGSNQRASREQDWAYRELLQLDIPAGLSVARRQLPDVPWIMGGHSLGAQLALLHAARHAHEFEGAWVIAGGQPWWRTFPPRRRWLLWLLTRLVRPLTALCGYFPGARLRFAGREASGLMRDWSFTARSGAYAIPSIDDDLDAQLAAYDGRVLALRMNDDWLAPAASLAHLRRLTAAAQWREWLLESHHFDHKRADHFGWLKEPAPVVERIRQWLEDHGVYST